VPKDMCSSVGISHVKQNGGHGFASCQRDRGDMRINSPINDGLRTV